MCWLCLELHYTLAPPIPGLQITFALSVTGQAQLSQTRSFVPNTLYFQQLNTEFSSYKSLRSHACTIICIHSHFISALNTKKLLTVGQILLSFAPLQTHVISTQISGARVSYHTWESRTPFLLRQLTSPLSCCACGTHGLKVSIVLQHAASSSASNSSAVPPFPLRAFILNLVSQTDWSKLLIPCNSLDWQEAHQLSNTEQKTKLFLQCIYTQ